jgi:CheY-like chemotaxis protein
MANTKKRIMIVDDEPTWIKVLSHLLRGKGYVVHEAGSAKEALKTLVGFKPDLIVSDVRMPDMNGFDFLNEIRKNSKNLGTPVVFLTAIDDYDARRVAKELGATDYLIKPFDEQEVLTILSKHLNP